MSRCFTPSASGAQAAMTREGKIRALQDADRTRGDRDRVIFAAALVADYLAVSWASAFLEPLARRHTHTHTHTHASWNLSLTYLGASCRQLD
jgi:hypothetical protein